VVLGITAGAEVFVSFVRFSVLMLLVSCRCGAPDTGDSTPRQDSPADDTGDSHGDTGDSHGDTGDVPQRITVAPDDPALRYVGRWSFADPSLPTVGWQGASVALSFEGTQVDVSLDSGSRPETLRVIVDGDHPGSTRISTTPGLATLTVAQDLEPGAHSVELVKETYVGTDWVLHGVEVLGQGVLDPPPVAPRHIEFYGDSNLAGSSLMSERNQGGVQRDGSHFTFAGITARAFGADYHNVSVSGETLAGMTSLYDRQSWYDQQPSWDFTSYAPDLVVMNLGANDINGAGEATIRGRYVTMLDLLRAAHPGVPIVVFNGYGWDFDEPADYTAEVVAELGDPLVTTATFPWVFEQWHGCEYDHGGMARYLIRDIEDLLGWTAEEPAVMNGFGLDGGLANGGFEEQAPFGGFGWRYLDDPGVERVQDPSSAYEGEHLLRLGDGAQVHQPNPASDGDVVTVSGWFRAAGEGETVDLTLDFRDQTMWSTPLASETSHHALTTAWQQLTVQATAPVGAARPVFHTRVTLQAGVGATVEVDGLTMSIE
jgi:hypothetical protein